MKIHDVEQQSREWLQLHIGLPTAGGLDNLLTPEFEQRKGEKPRSYVCRKVAEAWRGKPLIDLGGSSFAMEQGMILESEAIPFWELTTGRKITRVGFITTDDGRFGCSPDGIIAMKCFTESDAEKPAELPEPQCGIEIKCPAPHTHVKYLAEGVVPKEYRAQVQGGMFATGWCKWIFFSYCRGFPPLILEVSRDEKEQAAITASVKRFHEDFDRLKSCIDRWQKNPFNEFKKTHD